MTRADSRPSGETQSVPVAVFERVMFCMAPPSRRTAPTPTPVAAAAARAWRRVIPLRTGGTASTTGSGALRAMAGDLGERFGGQVAQMLGAAEHRSERIR